MHNLLTRELLRVLHRDILPLPLLRLLLTLLQQLYENETLQSTLECCWRSRRELNTKKSANNNYSINILIEMPVLPKLATFS